METVYLFVVLISASCVTIVAAGSCDKKCSWTPWSSWSDCSRLCPGGNQRRSRELCCKFDLADKIETCMAYCGMDYSTERSGFYDSRGCNEHCDNGGTFVLSGYCRCPDRFRGTCCKDVVTCGRPSTVSHGSFTGSDFTYAGKVHYTCDKNYIMTNPSQSTRTCTKYRHWTGSAPTCLYATSCNSSPCQNGASCMNLLGDYRCDCTSYWTGKNCEVVMDDNAPAGSSTNQDGVSDSDAVQIGVGVSVSIALLILAAVGVLLACKHFNKNKMKDDGIIDLIQRKYRDTV